MGTINKIAAAGIAVILSSCTSGNSAIEPSFKSANLGVNTLTFAVGTANYKGLATGLNTVVAYRQPNGLSGSLANTPIITGPPGFLIPSNYASAGVDAGTNHISGAPLSQQPGGNVTNDSFGQAVGAFAYGFLPLNSTNQASSGNNGYAPLPQPVYPEAVATQSIFRGGPPAYTNVRTGTYPSGFSGFSQGFDIFAGTSLATGSYSLELTIPTSPTTNTTASATATLANTTPLPTFPAPAVADDGSNGANITLNVPAGVTETIIDVRDKGPDPSSTSAVSCHGSYTASYYYTVVDHTAGPATVTVHLPGNVGPILPTTGSASPTLCVGDIYSATAIGADYRAYESGPGQPDPAGTSAAPSFLTGSQADITVSPAGTSASGVYGQ